METKEELKEETLLSHLFELRSRLLKAGASALVVFLVLAPFSDFIFRSIAMPLMQQLPEGSTMIATQVASPFLTPFNLIHPEICETFKFKLFQDNLVLNPFSLLNTIAIS